MKFFRKVLSFQKIIREFCDKRMRNHLRKMNSAIKLQSFFRKKIAQRKLRILKIEKGLKKIYEYFFSLKIIFLLFLKEI